MLPWMTEEYSLHKPRLIRYEDSIKSRERCMDGGSYAALGHLFSVHRDRASRRSSIAVCRLSCFSFRRVSLRGSLGSAQTRASPL